jgi:hypothetical protein
LALREWSYGSAKQHYDADCLAIADEGNAKDGAGWNAHVDCICVLWICENVGHVNGAAHTGMPGTLSTSSGFSAWRAITW